LAYSGTNISGQALYKEQIITPISDVIAQQIEQKALFSQDV